MSAIAAFHPWIGVWAGSGETQAGQKTFIRTDFAMAMDDRGLRMHFEAWDDGVSILYHGVRAVLAPAPSGVVRAIAFSTIHGPLLLDLTPDDEGVMALAGDSLTGNHISVTFMQDAPDRLMFAAFWRPAGEGPGTEGPRMTCALKPATPWVAPGR